MRIWKFSMLLDAWPLLPLKERSFTTSQWPEVLIKERTQTPTGIPKSMPGPHALSGPQFTLLSLKSWYYPGPTSRG
eukprot:scaffold272929_cov13-Tisochrysis_lutea.AAC.1